MTESTTEHWRHRLHEIIFEADTPIGKAFDIALIIAILASVIAVMLDSVPEISAVWGHQLYVVEWFFTIAFTVEYLLRIFSLHKPWKYMTSFYGLVDLLSILPTYLSLFVADTQYLLVIRILRTLRVFRILKFAKFLNESNQLQRALFASRRKITVFLFSVISITVILGSVMYLIEGPENGFTSIPTSVYWAIVTLTTVGYGDIAPGTPFGKAVASLVMITGYGIIAVPTGIVTAEIVRASNGPITTKCCPDCGTEGHDPDAAFCKDCGAPMHQDVDI